MSRWRLLSSSADPLRRWVVVGAVTLVSITLALFVGPATGDRGVVVVYTALDEAFSRPIFEQFSRNTGIIVRAKYDTESTKSVGLTQAILAERARPRCDVFWNNEIVNTLRLEQAGLLEEYASQRAGDFPEQYRSAESLWHGFAARARVLVVNTELVSDTDRPSSITDLADPQWRGKVGIAKPLSGTTASHAACLFVAWGQTRAERFFLDVRKNARILGGNKQVAQAVARGELAFGLTDTDDAIIEQENGWPVAIVIPDQAEDQLGTLLIPNTVSIIRGAPHLESARVLVDYLLSPEVEKQLATGPSAQIPLGRSVNQSSRIGLAPTTRSMQVDFQAAAAEWETTARFLRRVFTSAD